MHYRREIDGLRALAVIPVILFHAGVQAFSGGFVGVDVFFVISGYLITTIILSDLEQNTFSSIKFYERRARRILPALFVMMATCLIVGYFTLMPDEFKSLGQSVVATTLFSNNILLAMTSGYWDLASEYKPLLHTWSLGVEEQYYFIFPPIMIILWKKFRTKIPHVLALLFAGSLLLASWMVYTSPNMAFYTLPTRAWEILLGALTALYLSKNKKINTNHTTSNTLSLVGILLIIIPAIFYNQSHLSPGPYLLAPTIGTALIIIFAQKETYANKILGHQSLVSIGLVSYSLYLWHQPVFSFIRITSADRPATYIFCLSIILVSILSYLSWRFIEKPFRNTKSVSRKTVFTYSSITSIALIAIGLYLNKSYGVPQRLFDTQTRIEDMDKRIYNERVFSFKNDSFSSNKSLKLLIIGNSFARDFVNMTTESFDTSGVEIVYRNDLTQCITPYKDTLSKDLFESADVIVFASGELLKSCLSKDLSYADTSKKKIYYSGIKHFGYNLNWIILLDKKDRANQYNQISKSILEIESDMLSSIPALNFISLLAPTLKGEKIPITDNSGRMLSTDRAHLTKFGAIYFGDKSLKNSEYANLFKSTAHQTSL